MQGRSDKKKLFVITCNGREGQKRKKEGKKVGRRKEKRNECQLRGKKPGRKRSWPWDMTVAGASECASFMDRFPLCAPSLLTANLGSQPTGNSVCHCKGVEHFELQAFCTPKLHTVIHIAFELFRNTEANYSWHVLLSYYPERHPPHVELCHIKCPKS